jgi:hypothetical protein
MRLRKEKRQTTTIGTQINTGEAQTTNNKHQNTNKFQIANNNQIINKYQVTRTKLQPFGHR